MPSKKKKYNARFPAVSKANSGECVLRIEFTQIVDDDDDWRRLKHNDDDD